MDLHEFDNVKAEKAIAMRRYRRRRNLKWLSEACAALFVLTRSSTWLPIAMEYCAGFSRQLIAVFKSHLFVFALFNLIIFLVYALSGKFSADKHLSGSESGSDFYDEFVSNSVSSRRFVTGGESTASAPEILFQDKQMISSENAASRPAQNDRQVTKEAKGSSPPPPPGHAKNTVCTDEEKSLVAKCYLRTTSEKLNSYKHSRREFRRSDTEIEPARRSSSVDQMSNDDFNRAIEAFIATQKSIQWEEYKEETKNTRMLGSHSLCH